MLPLNAGNAVRRIRVPPPRLPGVETLGYHRLSLRDKAAAALNFRKAL